MAVFKYNKRYIWFCIDAALPAPSTTPTYLRPRSDQSTAEWMTNDQDEDVATGDNFVTVDSIPNNPHSEITIVHDFFPSTMQAFLANCCLLTGAGTAYGPLIDPVSMTIGIGNGLDEDQYAGCQLTALSLTLGNPCYWTAKFVGSEKPVAAAYRSSPTLPTIERALRLSNLALATLPASGTPLTEKFFNQLTIDLVIENNAIYDSRGDGIDGISARALDKLGASATIERAYQSATEKAAFLAECGQDGPMNFQFVTTCGTGTHTHEFNFPRARYTKESVVAQKSNLMREPLVALGLRPLTTQAGSLFSPLGYKYTVA